MRQSRYKITGRQYQPDKDVDVESLQSKILKELYKEFSSVFQKSEDSSWTDINFLNKDNSAFFTFHDSDNPLMADCTRLTEQDKAEMNDFYLYVPWLMCLYVCELWRGKGRQKMIFNRIIELSEVTGEPFYAVADPFVLCKRKISNDIRPEFLSFHEHGHKRPDNWCEMVEKQVGRFQSYGLQNFVLPSAELTEPFQHWIYIPTTASNDHKKIIATLLLDSPIDCERQLSKAG
jgi:hypothetical protein